MINMTERQYCFYRLWTWNGTKSTFFTGSVTSNMTGLSTNSAIENSIVFLGHCNSAPFNTKHTSFQHDNCTDSSFRKIRRRVSFQHLKLFCTQHDFLPPFLYLLLIHVCIQKFAKIQDVFILNVFCYHRFSLLLTLVILSLILNNLWDLGTSTFWKLVRLCYTVFD